jgi:hypothetical protein
VTKEALRDKPETKVLNGAPKWTLKIKIKIKIKKNRKQPECGGGRWKVYSHIFFLERVHREELPKMHTALLRQQLRGVTISGRG